MFQSKLRKESNLLGNKLKATIAEIALKYGRENCQELRDEITDAIAVVWKAYCPKHVQPYTTLYLDFHEDADGRFDYVKINIDTGDENVHM